MKYIVIVCVLVIVAAAVAKSYYDGQCNYYGYAGSSVTLSGVSCWRRVNTSFDVFEPLSRIEERARKMQKLQECIDAGNGIQCDPRYMPPSRKNDING